MRTSYFSPVLQFRTIYVILAAFGASWLGAFVATYLRIPASTNHNLWWQVQRYPFMTFFVIALGESLLTGLIFYILKRRYET